MQAQHLSAEQLLRKIAILRREVENLKRDKADLEILLETTTLHADTVEAQLHSSNQQLQAEIVNRRRAEAALQALAVELQSLLTLVNSEKADLEILLETTTQHGDTVEELLYDKAEAAERKSRKIERQLIKCLDALPVGVAILDASGKSYYGNQKARQLLSQGGMLLASADGFAEAYQIYKAGTDEVYPNPELPGVKALRGEIASADDLEIRRGDTIIPVESWGTPIFDDKGNVEYAIVAFQDISQRKRAEVERKKFTYKLYVLNQAYERFVPRQFLQFLNKKSIVDVKLGDQVQKEMSILFSDIRDFTSLSESMTPEDNFKFLNAYLSRMEPAVIRNNGFIDKYIGDEIMALFSGGADDAVKAGIAMLQTLTEYNQHRLKSSYAPIKIGIGINTGLLMLGTVGGTFRMDSTVISDAVNLASRLEEMTKYYKVPLLISHHTFSQLQDANQYAFRLIDRVQVRGKTAAVSVYEVFDADRPEIRDGKLATKQDFEQALLLFHMGAFNEAAKLFQDCLRQNPMDKVAQSYLDRCQQTTD